MREVFRLGDKVKLKVDADNSQHEIYRRFFGRIGIVEMSASTLRVRFGPNPGEYATGYTYRWEKVVFDWSKPDWEM